MPDAHGWVKHWEDPLLDSNLANDYQAEAPFAFTQIKCNTCHRYDKQTTGADYVNAAKKLINEKGCRACHTINGRGGAIGPDLTSIGDKQPEQYDFSRLTEFPSVFNWQIGHLQNPKSFTPGTVMPDFGFSSHDAQSIAMLLASWKDLDLPPSLLPDGPRKDVTSPEEAEQERVMREGEGRFFVEKTCFICHDVSSLGIHSATKIGPDLALAEEDAPRRFGVPLEEFLHNPSGTMSVVLTRQIHLSDAELDEAIRLLKVAHQKYVTQQQQAKAAKTTAVPAPSSSGQSSPTK
jgi:cytochrome c2